MNAVQRLWRALEEGDWEAARRQFHAHARVTLPHSGEVLDVGGYLLAHRVHAGAVVTVHAITGPVDERPVAVRATFPVAGTRWQCAGFYDLQQARISGATELWVPERELPTAA